MKKPGGWLLVGWLLAALVLLGMDGRLPEFLARAASGSLVILGLSALVPGGPPGRGSGRRGAWDARRVRGVAAAAPTLAWPVRGRDGRRGPALRTGCAARADHRWTWSFRLGCALRVAWLRCRRHACGIPIRGIDPVDGGEGWDAHVDDQAAVGAGGGVDVAPVGVGHGANDGQAKSCPMVATRGGASLGGGESAERFEQAGDLVDRHRGARVFHGELGVAVIQAAGDRDPSVFGEVVADGVVDEVLAESLQQGRVACHGCRGQRGAELDTGLAGGGLRLAGDVPDDLCEVDWTVRAEAFLAAGEGEQAVDEVFVAVVDGEQGGAELTQRLVGLRVVEGDLDERAVDGQRGAELVGG